MNVEKVVSKLTKTQKKAILLFGETYNKYRYKDCKGEYGKPFLWCDSRFTPESAPSNVLDSLGSWASKFFPRLVFPCFSLYSGDYYFLTEKGEEVLRYLKATECKEDIQDYINTVKRNSRPPGGLKAF